MSGIRFLLVTCSLLSVGRYTAELALGADTTDGKLYTQVPEISPTPEKSATQLPPSLDAGPTPYWIWGPDPNQNYVFEKVFNANSKRAWLVATCDNNFRVRVNDQVAAESGDWHVPVLVDVQKLLQPGKNVVRAIAKNEGGPAGVVIKLILEKPDGTFDYVVTDDTWECSAGLTEVRQAAIVRLGPKLGEGPWGNVFATSGSSQERAQREMFQVPPGFQVERLFTVPGEKLGSWVSICVDAKGRLIVSDQGEKGLCRITPSPIGSKEPTKVEHLDVQMTGAQGLLWAFDSLYASMNLRGSSALYRLRDTNGDDQFDDVQKLQQVNGWGEHGAHSLLLSPDGKSIYWIAGNHTPMPESFKASRLPKNWQEDQILPRMWDANGHAVGVLAPGGWVVKTDPEGKTWEVITTGYRNPFDMGLNADGELFVYDADMEWDMGMPWYRPTRVSHSPSGSELGWRSGSGKWPAYYPDSLPAMIDIGPGSPVGVTFGYGAKFPARYQKALYVLDWTFGTIHALHLEPNGATYKATEEEFVSRTPLPLTDAVVGADGAFYFTIGGRGAQSELFRVTYVGNEPTNKVDYHDGRSAALRELRHKLEAFHTRAADSTAAVEFAYPYLSHSDRFIRYAARVALENQDVKLWQDRVLAEKNPEALITGAVALARQGEPSVEPALLKALDRIDFSTLNEPQQLELLRAWGLVFIRLGKPEDAVAATLADKFDAIFPAKSDFLNRELFNLLVYLQNPKIAAKGIALLKAPSPTVTVTKASELLARNSGYGGTIENFLRNQPDAQKLHYAFALRNLKTGWTVDLRKAYFQFLRDSRSKSGGASYQGFLRNIDNEAFETCTEPERLAIDASGSRVPFRIPDLPKAKGPGQDWTMSNLSPLADRVLKGRDFNNGKTMFAAARCVVCHRFGGDGGATGPDLTQVAGRFNYVDLCTSIVDPAKVVSDQYRASSFVTADGKVVTGRVLNETADEVTVLIDPQDPTKIVVIAKKDIEDRQLSPASLMPSDLLKPLSEKEVLDLLAYLLARGNPSDPAFR